MKGTRATQAYDAAMKHAEAEKQAEVVAARRAAEELAAEDLAALRKAWEEDKQHELAAVRRLAETKVRAPSRAAKKNKIAFCAC